MKRLFLVLFSMFFIFQVEVFAAWISERETLRTRVYGVTVGLWPQKQACENWSLAPCYYIEQRSLTKRLATIAFKDAPGSDLVTSWHINYKAYCDNETSCQEDLKALDCSQGWSKFYRFNFNERRHLLICAKKSKRVKKRTWYVDPVLRKKFLEDEARRERERVEKDQAYKTRRKTLAKCAEAKHKHGTVELWECVQHLFLQNGWSELSHAEVTKGVTEKHKENWKHTEVKEDQSE